MAGPRSAGGGDLRRLGPRTGGDGTDPESGRASRARPLCRVAGATRPREFIDRDGALVPALLAARGPAQCPGTFQEGQKEAGRGASRGRRSREPTNPAAWATWSNPCTTADPDLDARGSRTTTRTKTRTESNVRVGLTPSTEIWIRSGSAGIPGRRDVLSAQRISSLPGCLIRGHCEIEQQSLGRNPKAIGTVDDFECETRIRHRPSPSGLRDVPAARARNPAIRHRSHSPR